MILGRPTIQICVGISRHRFRSGLNLKSNFWIKISCLRFVDSSILILTELKARITLYVQNQPWHSGWHLRMPNASEFNPLIDNQQNVVALCKDKFSILAHFLYVVWHTKLLADRFAPEKKYRRWTKLTNLLYCMVYKNCVRKLKG